MKRQSTLKIAVAGIGGIGGYIGGKLASYYSTSDDIHLTFICRGATLVAIKENGLELRSNNETINCRPQSISEDPHEIGQLDVLILCTKSFAVVEILRTYSDCMTPNTIVITTQNTVSGEEAIRPNLPPVTTLFEGVIYIGSNSISPGKINHVSGPSKLIFGTKGSDNSNGIRIAKLFNQAGIDTTFTTCINSVLWKKFMFVSPAALVTALHNVTIPEIRQDEDIRNHYCLLISELMDLANAKKIEVDANTIANNCALLENFAPRVKSSFQLDLENNNRTEIESLVHYVIAESKLYGLNAIHYTSAFNELTKRNEIK